MDDQMFERVGGDLGTKVLQWMKWADSDYLAARILFLEGLLVPGCSLANTALEKYLKAICYSAGIEDFGRDTHNAEGLYQQIRRDPKRRNLSLNTGYLRLLSKAYLMRYPVKSGFNIALNQAKLLAQLDRSVFEITSVCRVVFGDKILPTILEKAKHDQNMAYLAKNVAIDLAETDALFLGPNVSYEFRNHNGHMIVAEYPSFAISDDLVFDTEGVAPRPSRVNPLNPETDFTHAYPTVLKQWIKKQVAQVA